LIDHESVIKSCRTLAGERVGLAPRMFAVLVIPDLFGAALSLMARLIEGRPVF
jgi:hypothetical protein